MLHEGFPRIPNGHIAAKQQEVAFFGNSFAPTAHLGLVLGERLVIQLDISQEQAALVAVPDNLHAVEILVRGEDFGNPGDPVFGGIDADDLSPRCNLRGIDLHTGIDKHNARRRSGRIHLLVPEGILN